MKCEKVMASLESFIFEELSGGEAKLLSEHLESCAACRMELELLKKVDSIIRESTRPDNEQEKVNSLWESLNDDIRNCPGTPVATSLMTPVELAAYLNVPLRVIHELMPELPVIHLGDRLRFRKSSIDTWLKVRESASERLNFVSTLRY